MCVCVCVSPLLATWLPPAQTSVSFPGGSCLLLCRLPAAMILSLTSVSQRLSLFWQEQ